MLQQYRSDHQMSKRFVITTSKQTLLTKEVELAVDRMCRAVCLVLRTMNPQSCTRIINIWYLLVVHEKIFHIVYTPLGDKAQFLAIKEVCT
jgi:hypothetical protein